MYILAKVVPNSKSSKIEELTLADIPEKFQKFNPTKFIKVWVRSPAKQGKANNELIKIVSKKYAGDSRIIDVKVISGISSKYKLLQINYIS